MEKQKRSPEPGSGKKPDQKVKLKSSPEANKDLVTTQEIQYLTRCTRFRLSTEYELSICNCKHIMRMTIGERHSVVNPQKWLCNMCYTTESVWACLSCPNVACGRYIHEHALNHYLETSHPLVIDVNELYVYCYECEEYVLNDNKSGDVKVLRETLQAIRYQNFTGTTRSGHTLRTATISADEDVQMRRRLQQQQLDRDDRNFTAIWHSRFVRQRKTFRHWLHYVRYKKIFGTDDSSDSEHEALLSDRFVNTMPAKDIVTCQRTLPSPLMKLDPLSLSPSQRSIAAFVRASDTEQATSSKSPPSASPVPSLGISSTSSPTRCALVTSISSDDCITVDAEEEKRETATAQSSDALPEAVQLEEMAAPTPPLSSAPNSDSEVPFKSVETSVVIVLADSNAADSKDATVTTNIPSLPTADESVSSPPSPCSDIAPLLSEDNTQDLSDDDIPLSQLSFDSVKRPKRANAASRYKAIMNQLSPSLTSNEPIKKRLRIFKQKLDGRQGSKQEPLRRCSLRISRRLVEAKKPKKVSQRIRKRLKKPPPKQSNRGAVRTRKKVERKLPSRTLPARRTRMQNISKSIYDSVPNRAVTSLIPGVTGLRNLGNTCYLNSIIQVLGHLQKFRRCLLAVRDLEFEDKSIDKSSAAAKLNNARRSTLELYENQVSHNVTRRFLRMQAGLNGGRESGSPEKNDEASATYSPKRRRYGIASANSLSLCHELHDLYHVMWSGKWKLVSPYHFLSSVWQLIPSFRGYSQQDAQEFLCELLDKIVSELEKRQNPHANKADRLAVKISQVVHTVFEGRLHSQVRCLECKNVSSTYEPFWDLSLEFPHRYHSSTSNSWKNSHQGCNLVEMLEKFTEAERLDGGRVYSCSHCNSCYHKQARDTRQRRLSLKKPAQKLSEAEKQIKIVDLPQVLRFHLKRFRWSGRNHREKITVPVNFPAELDMRPHCWVEDAVSIDDDSRFTYDLSAVVIHHGRGFSAGHYTAYCWNDVGKFWVHCNDSNLELCSIDDVMAAQAYILFYSQRGLDPYPRLFTPPSTPNRSPPVTPLFQNKEESVSDLVLSSGNG